MIALPLFLIAISSLKDQLKCLAEMDTQINEKIYRHLHTCFTFVDFIVFH